MEKEKLKKKNEPENLNLIVSKNYQEKIEIEENIKKDLNKEKEIKIKKELNNFYEGKKN